MPEQAAPFSSTNQPDPDTVREANQKSGAKRRAQRSLRDDMDAVLFSFGEDSLGRQAWLRQFLEGGAENKRAFLQARVRLEPTQIHGQIDGEIIVRVVTQLGDREIDVTRPNNLLLHANSRASLPVGEPQGRAAEDPVDA